MGVSQRVSSCRLSTSAIVGSSRWSGKRSRGSAVPGHLVTYREVKQLQKIRAVLREGRRSEVGAPG